MNTIPTTTELALQAREILRNDTMTPKERWEFLIERGIIDREGRVICQKLFGGNAVQDTPAVPDKPGQV